MYTSDEDALQGYFEGLGKEGARRAARGVWANACWLGLDDGVLAGVCARVSRGGEEDGIVAESDDLEDDERT